MFIANIKRYLLVALGYMRIGVVISGMAFSQSSNSEQAISLVLPASLQAKLQTYNNDSPFPCGGDAALNISHALANDSNDLLLYLEVPNYLCDHHMVVEVLVDHNQQWKELSAWEGRLREVVSSSTGLIALSHWEIEGTYPQFLFRTDLTEWQTIPLPKDRYHDCCFEMVNALSVSRHALHLQMYKEDTVLPYWKLPINELLTLSSIAEEATVPWALAGNIKQPSQSIQSGHWQALDIHKPSESLYKLESRFNKSKAHWLVTLPMLSPFE